MQARIHGLECTNVPVCKRGMKRLTHHSLKCNSLSKDLSLPHLLTHVHMSHLVYPTLLHLKTSFIRHSTVNQHHYSVHNVPWFIQHLVNLTHFMRNRCGWINKGPLYFHSLIQYALVSYSYTVRPHLSAHIRLGKNTDKVRELDKLGSSRIVYNRIITDLFPQNLLRKARELDI